MKKSIMLAGVLAVLLIPGVCNSYTDKNWIGGSGDWFDPAHWNPYGVPNSGDFVHIVNNDTADITVRYSDSAPRGRVFENVYLGSRVILNVISGEIATSHSFSVAAGAVINQLGGIVFWDMPGLSVSGIYNLNIGHVGGTFLRTEKTGVFNQNAGTGVSAVVSFQNEGVYNLLGEGFHTINLDFINAGTINAHGITNTSGNLFGLDILGGMVTDIHGDENTLIYYNPGTAYNSYKYGGLEYALNGGGVLRPLPEPSILLLLTAGLLGIFYRHFISGSRAGILR